MLKVVLEQSQDFSCGLPGDNDSDDVLELIHPAEYGLIVNSGIEVTARDG